MPWSLLTQAASMLLSADSADLTAEWTLTTEVEGGLTLPSRDGDDREEGGVLEEGEWGEEGEDAEIMEEGGEGEASWWWWLQPKLVNSPIKILNKEGCQRPRSQSQD